MLLSCVTACFTVQGGSKFWFTEWSSVTIQLKAIEQYFAVVLFFLLYSVVLPFQSVVETHGVTIQMKTIE